MKASVMYKQQTECASLFLYLETTAVDQLPSCRQERQNCAPLETDIVRLARRTITCDRFYNFALGREALGIQSDSVPGAAVTATDRAAIYRNYDKFEQELKRASSSINRTLPLRRLHYMFLRIFRGRGE